MESSDVYYVSATPIPTGDDDDDLVDAGPIIVIAVGAVVAAVLLLILTLYFVIIIRAQCNKRARKARQRQRRNQLQSHGGSKAVTDQELQYEPFSKQEDSEHDSFEPPSDDEAETRLGETIEADDEHVYDDPPLEDVDGPRKSKAGKKAKQNESVHTKHEQAESNTMQDQMQSSTGQHIIHTEDQEPNTTSSVQKVTVIATDILNTAEDTHTSATEDKGNTEDMNNPITESTSHSEHHADEHDTHELDIHERDAEEHDAEDDTDDDASNDDTMHSIDKSLDEIRKSIDDIQGALAD